MENEQQMLLSSQKEISDRTNIIIAANSFLLLPFVSTLTSPMITGYLNAVPVLICIFGIGLNPLLIYTNLIQHRNINTFLNSKIKTAPNFIDNYKKIGLNDAYTCFNKYAPPFLTVVWIACLTVFILQKTLS
jgi:hypothetical protein